MWEAGLSKGEACYQSEPLTTRLKNLIRDYPEGVGIMGFGEQWNGKCT
jgi:hypothetical protein